MSTSSRCPVAARRAVPAVLVVPAAALAVLLAPAALAALLAAAALPVPQPLGPLSPVAVAHAQARTIPAAAKLGILKVGVFPQAELNGNRIILGPGMRLHDQKNVVVMPASVKDMGLRVAYLTGPSGEVVQAWILTDAEYRALQARR